MDYTGFRPQAADEIEPALNLNTLLLRSPQAAFFALMHGHAMTRAGIRHGDLLVIEAAETYRSGQIVLAFVNHEALVRRLDRTATGFALVSSQPNFPIIQLEAESVIRGRVIAAITLLAGPRVKLPLAG